MGNIWGSQFMSLNRLVRESLSGKGAFEQRPDCGEGEGHVGEVSRQRNSQCKGPERAPDPVTQTAEAHGSGVAGMG